MQINPSESTQATPGSRDARTPEAALQSDSTPEYIDNALPVSTTPSSVKTKFSNKYALFLAAAIASTSNAGCSSGEPYCEATPRGDGYFACQCYDEDGDKDGRGLLFKAGDTSVGSTPLPDECHIAPEDDGTAGTGGSTNQNPGLDTDPDCQDCPDCNCNCADCPDCNCPGTPDSPDNPDPASTNWKICEIIAPDTDAALDPYWHLAVAENYRNNPSSLNCDTLPFTRDYYMEDVDPEDVIAPWLVVNTGQFCNGSVHIQATPNYMIKGAAATADESLIFDRTGGVTVNFSDNGGCATSFVTQRRVNVWVD